MDLYPLVEENSVYLVWPKKTSIIYQIIYNIDEYTVSGYPISTRLISRLWEFNKIKKYIIIKKVISLIQNAQKYIKYTLSLISLSKIIHLFVISLLTSLFSVLSYTSFFSHENYSIKIKKNHIQYIIIISIVINLLLYIVIPYISFMDNNIF